MSLREMEERSTKGFKLEMEKRKEEERFKELALMSNCKERAMRD
jgi:hypothetical protein